MTAHDTTLLALAEKTAMSRAALRCGSVAVSIKKPKVKIKKATLEKRGFWRKWKTLDDVEAEITADDIKKARKAGMSEAKIRRRYGPTIKTARTLSARGRNQISEKNFALPGGRYPIHDASHARNALARVAQHGTASEQAQVRAAVARKYPGIGQEKNAMKKTALRLPSNSKVIPVLNDLLARELAAINQYMVQHAMCDNWGYEALACSLKADAMGEMKHAEELIERIIFLEGTPEVQELEPVHIGKTVPEMLQNNLRSERDAVSRYNAGVELCDRLADNGTKKLLECILADEERHFDETEAKLGQIKQLGLPLFLSEHLTKTASAHPHMGKTAMSKNRVSSGVSVLDRIYGRRGQSHVSAPRNTGNYVEKTAARGAILGALGGGGLGTAAGLAAGGVGGAALGGGVGYYAAKKRGEKIDARTPYHGGHMRYAYGKGRYIGRAEVVAALKRLRAEQRLLGKSGKGPRAGNPPKGGKGTPRMHRNRIEKRSFVTPALIGGATGALTAPPGQKQQGALGGAAGGMLGGAAATPTLGTLGAIGGGLGGAALGGAAGTLAGIPGGPVGMVAGGAGGASAGGTLGAALGGGLGSATGLLGGSALGGYAGGRLMTDRPKKKTKKKVSVKGEKGQTLTIRIEGGKAKVKKAYDISQAGVDAANYVLEMRKSAHVNLRIPADVLGY